MGFQNKKGIGSEHHGQEELRKFMESKGWHLTKTHGSKYQSGLPDLFACHKSFGHRWIEVKKDLESGKFSNSQIIKFTELITHGSGVWILTGIKDYEKLFQPCNFKHWLRYKM